MNPDARFVIACPACQGRVAALAASVGRTGACPLCATTLVVPAAAVSASVAATPGGAFADLGAAPPPPRAAVDPALAFREPVRTVAAGDRAVELRRLSDEERRSRRARRNLLLLLIGGAALIALTVAFGKRPAR
jgi:ferric-dicitrate binding protein FerR (iron transport regulator)